MAVAGAAVKIHGAERFVTVGIGGRIRLRSRINRLGIACGVGVVLVLVVTDVPGAGLRLVLAVRRHGRPAELERHQGEQDDGEETIHGRESSGCCVRSDVNKATGLWGFTTSMRARAPHCGSSHGG